ncbi:pilus assembly protein FimV [Pseudomonas citronellolis]|uniref:FimV/HubP family polar landmark protein n=1 Tax=Pseudomonas citronellolis TaxID=53408 RepID=UPI0020A1EF34|nr:FimV/HubP family polar landmark protein [Pseudomonas citronellolis]MCP1643911.1 pilus assembly protein FimV [Pseudomonas citronellolis]MCP1666836.1 pilus assembly protein FimV [Pseudomonas citronellolis]MCP1697461.1 pilus assembly protein FimV [Pseudomonas citronellolis]MCP1704375.1 pilus assembly protein FimV [Pseudomonas citronellolis]MCP1796834.1 pilus assembly protein FimV [Pseudomonas citronellolis]
MARLTRLPLAMAVLSALMTSQAHALGLGDITVHSALNQPLDAEIELLQPGDLSSDELIARLADMATFERMGVDRTTFLQNLRFTPVLRNGRGYIRVVSTQPVHEPYLNFLLELERPNGRLLREYTLLIDPPGYAGGGSYAQSAPARGADSGSAANRPAKRSAAARPAPVPSAPIAAGEGRYTTAAGDTLWSISGRLGAKGAARQELMTQLQQLNPQAFIGGNPHRLRLGYQLVLPAGQAAPATATNTAAAAAPAVPAPSEATVAQAQGQLADMTAERERLNQRMDTLQQQLDTLQKALESRDQQVQSLQAELARRQAEQAAAPASAPVPEAAPAAPVVAPAPAPTAEAAKPVPQAPVAQDEENASLTRYWPWAALAALVLALGLVYNRRRKPGTDEPTLAQPEAASLPPLAPAGPAAPAKPVVASAVAPLASANEASLARLPAASSDSLEGANIYIAYGRFGQARDMLVKSVAAEPQRRDLRLKLLLVLAELGDLAAFHEQERALQAMGGDQKQIDQLKARYPAMLEREDEQAISDGLGEWDGLELGDIGEHPAPTQPPLGDTADLNLGELSLDLDWNSLDAFDSPKGSPAKGGKDDTEDLLKDFRSNLRELPEVTEFDLDDEQAGAFGLPSRAGGEQDKLLASLDQARACIDRGDLEEAYRILEQVLQKGDKQEQEEARELLARIA